MRRLIRQLWTFPKLFDQIVFIRQHEWADMRFKGLDLNLLVALNVLLEDRSVARAATRLRLSQPATSAALARLREFFNDEILILNGKRMYATPFAESLAPQVKECLRVADQLIATSAVFDPKVSQRKFRVVASDYSVAAIFSPLLRSMADEHLSVEFEFILPDQDMQSKLEQGQIDLFITPHEFSSSTQDSEFLFEERYVIVGCRTNSFFRSAPTEAGIFARPHVAIALGDRVPAFSDRQLQIMGKSRQIEITVSSFTLVPWLLIGTERLAFMHERLAQAMQVHFPIAFARIPFPFPAMRQMVQYHRTRAADDGLRWLIGKIRETCSPIENVDRK